MRIARLTSAALVCIMMAVCQAHAQGSVHGTVSDPLGAVVKDAKVVLMRGAASAGESKSGGDGAYNFSGISAGRYRVEVQSTGFENYTGQDIFVAGSGTTTINVLLQITALKDQVVVSATGSAMPVSQIGASVSLIASEDIQAQNKLDVLEDLRQVAGAQIAQTSQRGGTTSLFIRGGESSFNKVMIDGVPSNAIGGGFDYAQLSNSGVQSVEVLKGANSVLYGADALAGVVNLTTRRGTSLLPELKVSVDGGNFGTHDEAVSFAGAYRQFDYFSEFSRSDTRGSFPNDFFHNATYAGNVGWQPNSTTDVRVTYRRNWTSLGSPNGIALYGISDDSSLKNQNTYVSGTVQNQTTSRWHNLVRFAYGQFASDYVNPSPTGTPDSYGFGDYLGKQLTITGANGYSVKGQGILDYGGVYPENFPSYEARRSLYGQSDYRVAGDWTGTFGFRYEHEDGSGYTRDNYSYFTEGHGSVGHRLYLSGGVGYEQNAVFGFAATPRISAAYYLRRATGNTFFADTKVRFNFGKGIKEPSTYDQGNQLYALLTPAQRSSFGVGPVGPERSTDLDFGIGQGLFHGRARIEATYFHNRFYDLITYLDPTALVSVGVSPAAAKASGYGAYVNASSTRSQGVELEFNAELGHGLRLQANYTSLDATVTKAFGAPAFNPAFPTIPIGAYSPLQGQRPFHRAPNSGSGALIYSHRKFTGAFTGYIVGKRDDSTFLSDALFGNTLLLPNRDLAAAYEKFDLSGRYALRSYVSVYTSIENLFSQHYQAAFGFPAAPFTFRSGVTFTIGGENWKK